MNTIRLVLTLSTLRVLNSSPIIGIEPRNGTCCLLSRTSSEISPPSTMIPPSSTNTLVVIVRLFVIRSVALTCCELAARLEASCEILSATESPSLICGVILRMLPTSSRSRSGRGCSRRRRSPSVVNCPVMNGTSCAILISASSLSSVTIEGVAMMLVLPMPFSARISAAQLVPFSTSWPTPSVSPRGIDVVAVRIAHACDHLADADAVDRRVEAAGRQIVAAVRVSHGPVDAEIHRLVGRHLDQDRLDQHLRAADVEPVDDRHHRTHDLRRRGDYERVGLGLGPDADAAVDGALGHRRRCRPGAARAARATRAACAAAVMPWICSRNLPAIFSASA